MNKISQFLIAGGLLIFAGSCVHETDVNSLKAVSFASDIQPILAGNCTMSGCHDGSGGHEEARSLVTYDDVIQNGDVKAGDARGSKLYKVVANRSGENMPPSPRAPLSDDQIKLLYTWIEQGAKNN